MKVKSLLLYTINSWEDNVYVQTEKEWIFFSARTLISFPIILNEERYAFLLFLLPPTHSTKKIEEKLKYHFSWKTENQTSWALIRNIICT